MSNKPSGDELIKVSKRYRKGKPLKPRGNKRMSRDFADAFCHLLRMGVSIRRACDALNVSVQTYQTWRRHEGEEYVAFREMVDEARAQFEIDAVKCLHETVTKGQKEERRWTDAKGEERESETYRQDWRAAAFMLERRFPKEWQQQQVVNHEGEVKHVKRIVMDVAPDLNVSPNRAFGGSKN